MEQHSKRVFFKQVTKFSTCDYLLYREEKKAISKKNNKQVNCLLF